MKFGVREICDVVLKAKSAQKIGNKVFYAGEPVIYFDTLKTSSLEGAATTVYAQGGRGNSRLVAWEGERTLTFTMEDALISPEGFMILSGAGLIAANNDKPIYQHITETIDASDSLRFKFDATGFKFAVYTENKPYLPANAGDNFAYVMFMKNGEIITEPYIPVHEGDDTAIDSEAMPETITDLDGKTYYRVAVMDHKMYVGLASYEDEQNQAHKYESESGDTAYDVVTLPNRLKFDSVLVDYYTERSLVLLRWKLLLISLVVTIILRLLLYSVILMVQICLLNSLFLIARFSLTLPSLWLLLVIQVHSLSPQMHSLIILVSIIVRKFWLQFK